MRLYPDGITNFMKTSEPCGEMKKEKFTERRPEWSLKSASFLSLEFHLDRIRIAKITSFNLLNSVLYLWAVDYKYAYNQCCFPACWHCFELLGKWQFLSTIYFSWFYFPLHFTISPWSYLPFQRFPWFRIAYFFLWTAIYVVFQWIVHACFSFW